MIKEISNLESLEHSSTSAVIFGGTFDPIHQGHLGVIEKLANVFPRILVAPTKLNPWKDNKPTSFANRVEMINIAIEKHLPQYSIEVYQHKYQYAEEVILELRSVNPDLDLWWAVGEDIAAEVPKWRNWNTLNVSTVIAPIEPNIHASDIRKGTANILPCLEEYIRKYRLYEK